MSQPSLPITEDIMRPSTAPQPTTPPNSTDAPQLRKRISQVFTKMIVRTDSPPPLPPQVPLGPLSTIPNFSRPNYDASSKKDKEGRSQEVRSRKRLSKKASKRFSAPASPRPPERIVSESTVTTARQSIAILPPRSISNPLLASTTRPNPNSRTPSNESTAPSTASSSTSSTRKSSAQSSRTSSISTAPSSYSYPPFLAQNQKLSPPAKSSKYDPLNHYIPCLHPSCSTHYISASLGPTFFSAQQPYGLHRKQGLCPAHASKDVKAANVDCKKTYERMRQSAGRKTLGDIAREFDLYVKILDSERQTESRELANRQQKRVTGLSEAEQKGGKKKHEQDEEFGWRYVLRPCTRKSCPFAPYSVFSVDNFTFYSNPRQTGLRPLTTLCPACARRDVEGVETLLQAKREEMDDEDWVVWLEGVRKDRKVEEEFWEKAQERVVKESLGRKVGGIKEVEKNVEMKEQAGLVEGSDKAAGKRKEREGCVMM